MKAILILLSLCLGQFAQASIIGKVYFKGAPPAEKEIPFDAFAKKKVPEPQFTRFYVVSPNKELADVVVFVKVPDNLKGPISPGQAVKAEIRNFQYWPQVSALQAGQPFEIHCKDGGLHNVHYTFNSKGNRESNQAILATDPVARNVFTAPDLFARMKCDVHPWEFGYVSIFDHPYFGVTDTSGTYKIPELPPAKYILEAHHRKAGIRNKIIEVKQGEPTRCDFEF